MMRYAASTVLAVLWLAALPSGAWAEALGVEMRNGDVYIQQQQGWGRLTRDGRSIAVTRSRDGRLVAYVHTESGTGDEALNSISLCVIAEKSCRIIVRPSSTGSTEETLTGAGSPAFSYQAGVGVGGALVGSLFFQTSAYQSMGAIHRVTLEDGIVSFIAPAVSFTVVQSGRFTGALDLIAFRGGVCQDEIVDPNTRKVLGSKSLAC